MADSRLVQYKKSPLYEELTCIISCALQSDNDIQQENTNRLKKIEVIEEYPLVLAEIIRSDDEDYAERQLAAVFLKNYLNDIFTNRRERHALFEQDIGKRLLMQLLEFIPVPHQRIRDLLTFCVAVLLAIGFWNDAAPILNSMITSRDQTQVATAVYVLYEAIDDRFLERIERSIIYPQWFDVLINALKIDNISSEVRRHTLRPMFMLMKYLIPNPTFTPECLTKLAVEFEKILNEPCSPTSEFSLKCELLKYLNKCVEEFGTYTNIFIPPLLPAVGNLLTLCREQYKKIIRNTDKPPKDSSEVDEDSEGNNFFEMIRRTLVFIFLLIDMTYFEVLIEDLDNLIYCIYIFMSCHNDMEQQLYDDCLERNHYFSLRDTCSQILTYLLEKFNGRQRDGKYLYFKTMHDVFQRLNSEMDVGDRSDIHKMCFMSRLTESMIFGIVLIKERYEHTNENSPFPLDSYIEYWTNLLPHCNEMLRGKILWVGGIYCIEISPAVMECHLKHILQHFNGDFGKHVVVPSADALCHYLKAFTKMIPEKQYLISRSAQHIMDCLISIYRASDFPIHHALNALGYLIKSHRSLIPENIDRLEDILIQTTINGFSDPCVMREINFICAKIAQIQGFRVLGHDKFLAFLQTWIHNLEPRQLRHDIDKAFDLLNTICLFSPELDEYFILQTFTGTANRLSLNTERDVELDVSAGNLLITMIVKLSNQLKFIQREQKSSVIDRFPQLVEMLLQPDIELPRNILGKLVITAIFSLPELMEPQYETILRNVITSSAAQNMKTLRSTWSIFIVICMLRPSDTLTYLSVLPGPFGGSALNFIMKLWQPEYFHNTEPIERKIIVLSIVQLLQNCLENEPEHAKMEEVMIPFDRPNQESPTGEIFTGLEYLYYLLVQCLLYEECLRKIKSQPNQPLNFDDFGEDGSTRREEDDILLFHSHPFNIDIIEHIVSFLKRGTAPFYSVVRRFISQSNYFKLRDLGCSLPEQEMNVPEEQME